MSLLKIKKTGNELRDYYFINLEAGLIITLIFFNLLFRFNIELQSEFNITQVEQETIKMEEVLRTEQIHRPPPPPRRPAPRVVPSDELVEDIFFDLYSPLSLNSPPSLPPDDSDPDFDEHEIFTIVEEMPNLNGGMSSIYEYLKYPEIARLAGIEGRVIVQFVIDEQGNVVDPVVVRGIGGGCDEAALAAVRRLTFTPGRQRGRAVKVRYSLPIVFRLTK
ncbi:MAG: energy transducer TonB [Balneolales bacterium]